MLCILKVDKIDPTSIVLHKTLKYIYIYLVVTLLFLQKNLNSAKVTIKHEKQSSFSLFEKLVFMSLFSVIFQWLQKMFWIQSSMLIEKYIFKVFHLFIIFFIIYIFRTRFYNTKYKYLYYNLSLTLHKIFQRE